MRRPAPTARGSLLRGPDAPRSRGRRGVAYGGVPMTLATPDDGRSVESVERLFRLHGAWLLEFLNRRFGALVGEDAAQEAFVRTLASRTRIRNPRAFLAKVA